MKRRADGEGSIYRRADGRWCAAVSLGRGPGGKYLRRVVYAKSKSEALELRRQLLNDLAEHGAIKARPDTLDAYLSGWIEQTLLQRQTSGDIAESTRQQYADKMTLYVIGTKLGRTKLRDVTAADLREWLAWLSTRKTKRGKTMTPGGVRMIYRVLRAALQDAVDDELIARSPAATVRPPRAAAPIADPLTLDEARRVLDEPDQLSALWATFLLVGLRHGEALALQWSDVDLDERTLYVHRTVSRVRRVGSAGSHMSERTRMKTSASEATIPLPELAVEILREHRAAQARARLAAPIWVRPDLVFTTELGTLLEQSNVSRAWRRLCVRTGIRHRRVHDLRHTTASLLYARGVPVETISVILRHGSVHVTREIYTHVFAELQRAAVDELGGMLTRVQKS